jgi:hypothetical protein
MADEEMPDQAPVVDLMAALEPSLAAARAERALDPRSDVEQTQAKGAGAERLAQAERWLEDGQYELARLEELEKALAEETNGC